MLDDIFARYVPLVLASVLFFVVVGALLKGLFRSIGKPALGVLLLVVIGVLPVPMVQRGLSNGLRVVYAAVWDAYRVSVVAQFNGEGETRTGPTEDGGGAGQHADSAESAVVR